MVCIYCSIEKLKVVDTHVIDLNQSYLIWSRINPYFRWLYFFNAFCCTSGSKIVCLNSDLLSWVLFLFLGLYLFTCTILLCWIVVFYLKVLFPTCDEATISFFSLLGWLILYYVDSHRHVIYMLGCTIFLSGGEKNWWQPAGFIFFLISHPVNNLIYITTSNCICCDCDQCQLSGLHHHITPV